MPLRELPAVMFIVCYLMNSLYEDSSMLVFEGTKTLWLWLLSASEDLASVITGNAKEVSDGTLASGS